MIFLALLFFRRRTSRSPQWDLTSVPAPLLVGSLSFPCDRSSAFAAISSTTPRALPVLQSATDRHGAGLLFSFFFSFCSFLIGIELVSQHQGEGGLIGSESVSARPGAAIFGDNFGSNSAAYSLSMVCTFDPSALSIASTSTAPSSNNAPLKSAAPVC